MFGEPSRGAIDYLDYYGMPVPSGKYKFYIATTKRDIPPGQKPLDKTGIRPDIFIADSVQDWDDFVRKYYERR